MFGRVVEIAEDGRHLSLFRGFMKVSARAEDGDFAEIARVPLDGLAAVIGHGHGLSLTNNLIQALLDRNVSLMLCGPDRLPSAMLWPLAGHHRAGGRLRAQASAPDTLNRRLWRQIVIAKIQSQAAVLDLCGSDGGAALRSMSRRVLTGDSSNMEAQAARRYWPALMGRDFRRDTDQGGANGMLNYGYAILRSGVARSLTAAGLHPAFGLHHENALNPMCLADDLMEPFRPIIDHTVRLMLDRGQTALGRDGKAELVQLLIADMMVDGARTPLLTVLQRLAQSLATILESRSGKLDIPLGVLAAPSFLDVGDEL